ncbi:MAG: hypothetical protein HUU55_15360 [Myxococcales bacterium]|nr:hypothetical protein [Myxococcales bacterium]
MKGWKQVTLGIVLMWPGFVAAESASERVKRGDIVVQTANVAGSSTPKVIASAIVDAPMEKVWAVISNCSDYPKNMVRVADAQELSRNGNKVRCKVTIDMPAPLSDLSATTDAVHTVGKKRCERKWTLVEGDYKHNEGSWKLERLGEDGQKTLVVYEVFAEPNIAIPQALQKLAQEKSVPDLFKKLREVTANTAQ